MIVGAGLAGLICAHAMPKSIVVEVQPEPQEIHKALLRFRSTAVSDLTGIEFKAVEVRKGIYHDGDFHEPNIRLANLYSLKCINKVMGRSIWNLDPVVRYIAPTDFYSQMIESVGSRIRWGTDWKEAQGAIHPKAAIVSTAPMDKMLGTFNIDIGEKFKRAAITVQRFRVVGCDAYQTIYFPTCAHSMYRASITGDLMIVEFADEPDGKWKAELLEAFGLCSMDIESLTVHKQTFGKIAPIDNGKRRAAIARLSHSHRIYSVGRFATWRNILLDDVVKDVAVVKRLINGSEYDRKLRVAGEGK